MPETDKTNIENAIEAMLFACGEPLPIAKISLILTVSEDEIVSSAYNLKQYYEENNRGIKLVRMEDSLQLCSSEDFSDYVALAKEERKGLKLSRAALEALAVVAYLQPLTRAQIDDVRGVDSSYTVSSLLEKGLIEIAGHLDAPGRPRLYKTGENFLRVMGMESLNELPGLADITASESLEDLKEKISAIEEPAEQLSMNI